MTEENPPPKKEEAALIFEKGATARPEPKTGASKEKPERKATYRDYIITITLALLLVWQLGLLGRLASFIDEEFSLTPPKPIPQNFNVIVPWGDSVIDPATGVATLSMVNSAQSEATVTDLTIRDMDLKKCQTNVKLPLTIAPGERFNVSALGCGRQGTGSKGRAHISAEFKVTTLVKAKILADPHSLGPIPVSGLSDKQRDELRKSLEDQVNSLENANQPADFISSGTIAATYAGS